MNKFSPTSLKRLGTCDVRLQELMANVLQRRDISITSGHRGEEEQNILFEQGYSMLMYPHSRHNSYPSQAVDIVPWPEKWDSDAAFDELAVIVKEEAEKLSIDIVWGGDWTSFVDKPHWELRDV